jgi:hypothetical protein
MKKGVEIVPEENYKLRNEDTFEVKASGSNNTAGKSNFGVKGTSAKSSISTVAVSED